MCKEFKTTMKLNQYIIQSLTSDFKVAHVEPFLIYWGKKEFIFNGKTTPKTWYCLSVCLSGGRIMF